MTTSSSFSMSRVIYFSLKNRQAAKNLAGHLIKSPRDSVILPYIDHPGPLSSEILSTDFNSLTICERDPEIRSIFHSYVKKTFPKKTINVYSDDLFDLSYKLQNDGAQRRCAEIVSGSLAPKKPATESGYCDNPVKFLVPLLKSRNEVGFMRIIYYQLCLRIGLCANTLVHYYFLLSDRQYRYINARPKEDMRFYRASTVLYNTIFDIRRLESYDLETCFEINIKSIQKTASSKDDDYRKVHLILLKPKEDIIMKLGPKALVEFRFLVIQVLQRRRRLIIDYMGKFFDDFREDLLKLGIDEKTTAGDLSKEQYYMLFLYLKSRDDYEKSTFRQAAMASDYSVIL